MHLKIHGIYYTSGRTLLMQFQKVGRFEQRPVEYRFYRLRSDKTVVQGWISKELFKERTQ